MSVLHRAVHNGRSALVDTNAPSVYLSGNASPLRHTDHDGIHAVMHQIARYPLSTHVRPRPFGPSLP